ncbi:hypothetical protein BDF21DRAFT_386916 [Thamnidium elegans]|nr:hypothetical protein BDF21DRAFT_386916 [Thamnidium elegans]
MEDDIYQVPSTSDAYVLNMEPEIGTSDKRPRNSTQADVCYPYDPQLLDQHSSIELYILKAYIQKETEVSEQEQNTERHLTAKLDDLLESNEKVSISRRYSHYGDIIKNQSQINQSIERYTFYSADLGSLKNRSFKELLKMKSEQDKSVSDLLVDTTNWWIDVLAPTNEEMRAISKVNFRSFNHDYHSQDYLEAVSFYIIVFKDGVLTFRFQDLPHPHNVRRRIHQLKDFIKVTPEWINYALIDNITDSFAPLIKHTELEVDSIDDLVLVLNGSEQNDMLSRIGSCRKTVMQLLRLLGPKADVVKSLMKRYEDKAKEIQYANILQNEIVTEHDDVKVYHEVTLYLGDIQDHILTMLQNVNHYDLILGRAHRNYLGQISIELSQAGNTTNGVINRLTFFATIVVPLNLVGGLFGMNVRVPGGEKQDLVWFFWIVMGMLLYVIVMVAIGKRTGFL